MPKSADPRRGAGASQSRSSCTRHKPSRPPSDLEPSWFQKRCAPQVGAHWPLIALTMIAAALILHNLGADYLWEDEGDTALLARNILRTGLPVAWDGVTFIAPDYGERLRFGFVMISHPWLQYYLAAGSFALFGESAFAARVPFALAGIGTVVVVYTMGVALLRNRAAAVSAALLLTLSVQFLLYSRQARNYSLNALFTCLLVWQFHRLDSWRSAAVFAGLGIMLFHAHPIGLVAVAALAGVALVWPPLESRRRWALGAAVVIGLYAAPWLYLSRSGRAQATVPVSTVGELVPRLLQFVVEYASVTPLVAVLALWAALWFRDGVPARRHRRKQPSAVRAPLSGTRSLAVACGAIIVGDVGAMAATHTPNDMWVLGLHHTPALIPLTMLLAGLLITRVSERAAVRFALVVALGVTRVGELTPWVSWAKPSAERDPSALASFHVPSHGIDRVLRTTLIHFARSLQEPSRGVIARTSTFLKENASPGDVVITNYAWESLYFHTGLPQGAKIAPSFPIYEAAREAGLPDYVFGPDSARWLVCRRAFPAYAPGQDCGELLQQFKSKAVTTELMASLPDTLFENRENIHYRRYAGAHYVYPWYHSVPDVQIYRVNWESDDEAIHQRADASFVERRFEEAIPLYRRYLEAHPRDTNALSRIGIAWMASGGVAQALPYFRRAVEVEPLDPKAQRNLANALFDAGDAAGAVAHAETAITLRPGDPGAHDVLGRALAMLGRLDDAERAFERALEVGPSDTEAREHLEALGRVRALSRGGAP